jgi:hypothetical protein
LDRAAHYPVFWLTVTLADKSTIKDDAQIKIIRAPQTKTATLAKLAQIGGPSYRLALRITPTTAMRMYGTGIRKSPTATASGKLIATDAIAATVAKMLAIVP